MTAADTSEQAEPQQPWIAGGAVSPFVRLSGRGLLGRLSYDMVRNPITSLFAKHIGAPTQVIGLPVAAVTIDPKSSMGRRVVGRTSEGL